MSVLNTLSATGADRPTILLEIFPNGQIKCEALGFVGGACLETVELLIGSLGQVNVSSYKPEFEHPDVSVATDLKTIL